MSYHLLDGNVLIALTDADHVSHQRATDWFVASGGRFATCPITQGALIRYIMRVWAGVGLSASLSAAKALLAQVVAMDAHVFWPDGIAFHEVPETGITGYRQVTDAYLVALARHNGGRIATLDRTLAGLHGSDAVLIP